MINIHVMWELDNLAILMNNFYWSDNKICESTPSPLEGTIERIILMRNYDNVNVICYRDYTMSCVLVSGVDLTDFFLQ